MKGTIKKVIDEIIAKRSNGNPTIANTTKTKILLKGISADLYTADTPDDPIVLAKIRQIAVEFGVQLSQ